MKKILIGLFVILMFSCEDNFKDCPYPCPDAPYGTPDDTSTYSSGNFDIVTYVYYCYGGKYISIDYTRTNICDYWQRSDFITDGVCK
jgi:hypothetical protein